MNQPLLQLLSSKEYKTKFEDICLALDIVPKMIVPRPSVIPDAPYQQCVATYTFVQITLALILPTLILVLLAPPIVVIGVEESPAERWVVNQLAMVTKVNRRIDTRVWDGLMRYGSFDVALAVFLWACVWDIAWYIAVITV